MNFSGIPNDTVAGKALRYPLRFLAASLQMPILQGRLRGKKWIVRSGNHGYWLGSYEYEKRRAFEEIVTKGSVVFDIGAHVGFYTLLASKLVGINGKVFAFEPVPWNLHFLRSHVEINSVANVRIIEAAVCDVSGTALFDEGPNSSSGCIGVTGSLHVRTVTLDGLVDAGDVLAPDFMKIDVEGAEMRVLSGARQLLESGAPTLFLATHGRELHEQCCQFLRSLGYSLEPLVGPTIDQTDKVLARKVK